jgi:CHAD domain-containing protein
MISPKKLNNFFDERFEGIINSLNELCTRWDTETLHQLRVNAKKIKAVTELLHRSANDNKVFKTPELKALFKNAGNIRTAELHLEIFKQNNITDAGLIEAQKNIITIESEALCTNKDPYIKDIKNLHKRLLQNVTSIKNQSIISYYRNGLNELCSYFIIPLDVTLLHDSRKLIKNLLYPLKLMPLPLINKLNLNEEYLDYYQDIIGKWHDTIITLAFLKESNPQNVSNYYLLNNYREKLYTAIAQLSIDFDKKIIG